MSHTTPSKLPLEGARNRIASLDYLRGLMAAMIMFYHYLSWHFGRFGSSHFWGRVGIYGVSVFFILSGLTLYIVYRDKLLLAGYSSYFKRRILRIYPILILITVLTAYLVKYEGPRFIEVLLLNVTGLFGFLSPGRQLATGAWSIGNELVYYAIFPLVLLAARWKRQLLLVSFLFSLVIAASFAFYLLDPQVGLIDQWNLYVNPFNNLFLFTGGMLIAELFYFGRFRDLKWPLLVPILSLLVFVFYPVQGDDRINISTNSNRFVFSLCCFLFAISFLKFAFSLPKQIAVALKTLGDISYVLYLLHPLVYFALKQRSLLPINRGLSISVCVVITITLSFVLHHFFEKFFMNMGRPSQPDSAAA